ncbi:MAG: hypothetical protein ACOZNI_18035 [Myxococcota bacterium]
MSSTLIWLLLACPPQQGADEEGTSSSVSTRGGGVAVRAPSYEARAEAAWGAAGNVRISEKGAEFIAKVATPVATDVPEDLAGLPKDTKVVDIRKDDAVKRALYGTDDKAAADAIRATGAKLLVVHSEIRPSFDRDGRVLSRLYHHDALDHFQLARVEDGALVYLVVDAPLQLSPDLANAAVHWLRDKLSGKNPAPFPPLKPERSNWQLVASVRGQGQELAFSLAEAVTLDRALLEVANDLEVMHRRQREPMGLPPLREHIADLTIELHRVTERAEVIPRDEAALEDLWEMGIDGAVLLDRVGEKKQSGVWPGSVATARGITRADSFLKGIAKDFRWDSVRPWRDEEVELALIRTVHYMETPDGSVVPMYRGEPPVPLDFVNLTTVRDSVVLAGEWYLANLQPNGQVTYKMWPEENRYSNEYNHVRHTLATWNLWQAWTLDPRPEFMEGAIRAQKWTLESLGEWDGMAFLTHGGRTKLGSVVVALLGMVEVARATGDHSNDELMRKFGKFVMYMQKPSGTFYGYWNAKTHEYQEFDVNPTTGEKTPLINDIVPGEAALSLVYLYEYFDDPQYLEPLPKFFEFYKPWFKERADRRHADGAWPRFTYDNDDRLELVQFGPWTVMAASRYTLHRKDQGVADFGLEVARWMIDTYEYTSERAPYPDYVGGYYKFEGELPAMQAFCYGEGTAAAYDMALRMAPEQAAFFEKHTRETVRFGMQVQHDALDARYYSRPLEIVGGIRYAMNEPKVRIDYVHHALSAMYQWLVAAKNDPNLPAEVRAEPDEQMRRLMRLQDMPSVRDPALPKWRPGDPSAKPGTVWRTSMPAADAPMPELETSQVEEREEAGE